MAEISSQLLKLWLGIPSDISAPSYYRLLGLAELEPDASVIEFVSGWRIEFVSSKLQGPDASVARELLARMKSARKTLLKPAEKAQYDDQLSRENSHWKTPPPCSADDAARRWLGVVTPRYQAPSDHSLVGIPAGESDLAVVGSQFDQRLSVLNQLEQNTTDDEQKLVAELISLIAKAERRITKEIKGGATPWNESESKVSPPPTAHVLQPAAVQQTSPPQKPSQAAATKQSSRNPAINATAFRFTATAEVPKKSRTRPNSLSSLSPRSKARMDPSIITMASGVVLGLVGSVYWLLSTNSVPTPAEKGGKSTVVNEPSTAKNVPAPDKQDQATSQEVEQAAAQQFALTELKKGDQGKIESGSDTTGSTSAATSIDSSAMPDQPGSVTADSKDSPSRIRVVESTVSKEAIKPYLAEWPSMPKLKLSWQVYWFNLPSKGADLTQVFAGLIDNDAPAVTLRDNLEISETEMGTNPLSRKEDICIRAHSTTSLIAGRYVLRADSDDGIRVSVDGKVIFDRLVDRKMNEPGVAEIELPEGDHDFVVEYFGLRSGNACYVQIARRESAASPAASTSMRTLSNVRPAPDDNSDLVPPLIKNAHATYDRDIQRAKREMTEWFKDEIRLLRKSDKIKGEEKQHFVTELEADLEAFTDSGYVSFAPIARKATIRYLLSLKEAGDDLRKVYDKQISTQTERRRDDIANSLIAEKKKSLVPLAVWRFKGGTLLNSDGTVSDTRNKAGTWTWSPSGQALIIRYPDVRAPGGAWIDTHIFNAEGSESNVSNNGNPPGKWVSHRGTR